MNLDVKLDQYLAHLTSSERYAVLEQLWLWGTALALSGAVLVAIALKHLLN